ncbi:hypothetical protein [Brevibacillus borstelensis]|uniref:hypothetical protein n=1 Tax=Brevibacillus borstelensis TaxID=45462 RepID=UPI0030C57916
MKQGFPSQMDKRKRQMFHGQMTHLSFSFTNKASWVFLEGNRHSSKFLWVGGRMLLKWIVYEIDDKCQQAFSQAQGKFGDWQNVQKKSNQGFK